jgi:hypothetical protein
MEPARLAARLVRAILATAILAVAILAVAILAMAILAVAILAVAILAMTILAMAILSHVGGELHFGQGSAGLRRATLYSGNVEALAASILNMCMLCEDPLLHMYGRNVFIIILFQYCVARWHACYEIKLLTYTTLSLRLR